MTGPQILCLGRDVSLLKTRHLVLQTQFHATYCGGVHEAQQRWPGCPFDVLVLCHTLTAQDFKQAEEYAAQRTPPAALLLLDATNRTLATPFVHSIRNLDGPAPLLRAVSSLLRQRTTGTNARLI